ncbi:hypothetical protein Jiend_25520 [Micromonospora endophytica]|nr:hypothetical protein Jiend_25520 [Micromonospora endophytica]
MPPMVRAGAATAVIVIEVMGDVEVMGVVEVAGAPAGDGGMTSNLQSWDEFLREVVTSDTVG